VHKSNHKPARNTNSDEHERISLRKEGLKDQDLQGEAACDDYDVLGHSGYAGFCMSSESV